MTQGVRLFDTEGATHWRDLTVFEKRAETAAKAGLIIGAIVVAVGATIAVYFLATYSKNVWCNLHRTFHVIHYAELSAIPAIYGGIIAAAMFGGGIFLNLERLRNGFERNLTEPAANEEAIFLLSRGELKDVYEKYYHKNGGLGPLVRNGYMSPEQGDKLSETFQKYSEQLAFCLQYERQPRIAEAIQAGNAPEEYKHAREQIEEFGRDWTQIKEDIYKQYYGRVN
jgi:hypothetical protein